MQHYSDKPSVEYPEKAINNVAIIKVKIESMTGKNQYIEDISKLEMFPKKVN